MKLGFHENPTTYINKMIYFFQDAFKKTVEQFKHVDILINNAGIMNDGIWEKEIDINLVSIEGPFSN